MEVMVMKFLPFFDFDIKRMSAEKGLRTAVILKKWSFLKQLFRKLFITYCITEFGVFDSVR
jgi:hypothetical protein